jgi:hypothetical protein
MSDDTHTNETDLLVKYAGKKGGGDSGQLIIDDVELEQSRDNRIRHGIGNSEPQQIEKGNNTYTFSTTTYMSDAAAQALQAIKNGNAETQAVFIEDGAGNFKQSASGMVFNTLNTSASDDGDTTVEIDADLLGLEYKSRSQSQS